MANSNKRVLLSGASGFIASHIFALLIEEGYHVTACVRSKAKAQQILDLHPAWESNSAFVSVTDIATEGAFDDVFKHEQTGFDYIIHTASPVNFSITDFQKDLIDPAVKGTTGLIKCAHQLGGKSVKRIVLLGSAVAVLNSFQDEKVAGKSYTEKDWNPVTASQAIESKDPVLGYNASKKLAELAAWQYMKENQPSFDLTVINPDIVTGPMLQPVPGPRSMNETNKFTVYNFLNGTYKEMNGLKFPYQHFVDVRDVARAHVLSLANPAASNQRILLVSDLMTPQLIVNIMRKNFPDLRDRVVEGNPERILPEGLEPTGWDTSKSFEIFGQGWGYRSLENSVVDTVKCILELEKKWEG